MPNADELAGRVTACDEIKTLFFLVPCRSRESEHTGVENSKVVVLVARRECRGQDVAEACCCLVCTWSVSVLESSGNSSTMYGCCCRVGECVCSVCVRVCEGGTDRNVWPLRKEG